MGCFGNVGPGLMVMRWRKDEMVLGVMASVLVARHLKTTEDLHDSRPSPRTESLVASAMQWAERVMRRMRSEIYLVTVRFRQLSDK